MSGNRRTVSAHLEAWGAQPTTIVLAIAPSNDHPRLGERLLVSIDGSPVVPRELLDEHGGRVHVFDAHQPGVILVDYEATVVEAPAPRTSDELEGIRYLRPSRYCESDLIEPFARSTFGSLSGRALVDAVRHWVNSEIAYVPGASRPTDGAASTLQARQGVCRDFAHLTTALLRARDLPARIASVYAPGLSPMDFHAVTEVKLDDDWFVIDATGLAPRTAMVRIATGADAADIAFFTNIGGHVDFNSMSVTAVADDGLPPEDTNDLIWLA